MLLSPRSQKRDRGHPASLVVEEWLALDDAEAGEAVANEVVDVFDAVRDAHEAVVHFRFATCGFLGGDRGRAVAPFVEAAEEFIALLIDRAGGIADAFFVEGREFSADQDGLIIGGAEVFGRLLHHIISMRSLRLREEA